MDCLSCVPALRDEVVEGGLREHQLGLEGVPVEAENGGEVAKGGHGACVEGEHQETHKTVTPSRFLGPAPAAPPPIVGEGETEGTLGWFKSNESVMNYGLQAHLGGRLCATISY